MGHVTKLYGTDRPIHVNLVSANRAEDISHNYYSATVEHRTMAEICDGKAP